MAASPAGGAEVGLRPGELVNGTRLHGRYRKGGALARGNNGAYLLSRSLHPHCPGVIFSILVYIDVCGNVIPECIHDHHHSYYPAIVPTLPGSHPLPISFESLPPVCQHLKVSRFSSKLILCTSSVSPFSFNLLGFLKLASVTPFTPPPLSLHLVVSLVDLLSFSASSP